MNGCPQHCIEVIAFAASKGATHALPSCQGKVLSPLRGEERGQKASASCTKHKKDFFCQAGSKKRSVWKVSNSPMIRKCIAVSPLELVALTEKKPLLSQPLFWFSTALSCSTLSWVKDSSGEQICSSRGRYSLAVGRDSLKPPSRQNSSKGFSDSSSREGEKNEVELRLIQLTSLIN